MMEIFETIVYNYFTMKEVFETITYIYHSLLYLYIILYGLWPEVKFYYYYYEESDSK